LRRWEKSVTSGDMGVEWISSGINSATIETPAGDEETKNC
jgi:hypothetical protein